MKRERFWLALVHLLRGKRRVVNVMDFGADPSGLTDSGPAFQKAFAALSKRGGTVLIPKGRFLRCDTPLDIDKKIYLKEDDE